jgi:hypothetical protein
VFGRGVASLIGFIGGVLIVLGALVAFLLALAAGGAVAPLVAALVAGVLGLLVVSLSRPRIVWWPGSRLTIGLLLMVLAALAGLLFAANILIVVGAVAAFLSGVVFLVEAVAWRAFSYRGRLVRRRLW